MWEAYRIGLALGVGIGIGGLLAALLAPRRALLLVVTLAAAAAGAGVGYAIGGWHEAVAGGVGGALGAAVVAAFVAGALQRGGTRGGTAALVGLASVVLAALALVPLVGYLEAIALPALAARARGRVPERYPGLRSPPRGRRGEEADSRRGLRAGPGGLLGRRWEPEPPGAVLPRATTQIKAPPRRCPSSRNTAAIGAESPPSRR